MLCVCASLATSSEREARSLVFELVGAKMAKYLLSASYTQSGAQGLLKEGGSGRRAALTQTVESLGGSVDAFYYAFGSDDVIMIADFPDQASAVAMSMRINAAGALSISATALIDPETIDEAIAKEVTYRLPGE